MRQIVIFWRSTSSQLHTPPDLTVQSKLQKMNEGRDYTKIGNLDTIWEQQKDGVTMTDIANITDIISRTLEEDLAEIQLAQAAV